MWNRNFLVRVSSKQLGLTMGSSLVSVELVLTFPFKRIVDTLARDEIY